MLKVFKKNSLKLSTACHNTTSWYTDTDSFLEHSPSGRSLYYKGPRGMLVCCEAYTLLEEGNSSFLAVSPCTSEALF